MTEQNTTYNQFSENSTQINLPEKKKSIKKNNDLGDLKIVENQIKNIPLIIKEVLDKNFTVILAKNGYYINGFYGLNQESGKKGYIFCQETTDANSLVFFDNKGHKHIVKSFEDLVNLNSLIWGVFFKISEEYKKPDPLWFGYMLELGALNITPGR